MKNPVENKFASVQVEYDSKKLEAVIFYLRDKKTTIERELTDALDAVYKKNVPAQMREYIERKTRLQHPKHRAICRRFVRFCFHAGEHPTTTQIAGGSRFLPHKTADEHPDINK